jgi:hypothetical protein
MYVMSCHVCIRWSPTMRLEYTRYEYTILRTAPHKLLGHLSGVDGQRIPSTPLPACHIPKKSPAMTSHGTSPGAT